jgi:flagellar hook-length control protein FliK
LQAPAAQTALSGVAPTASTQIPAAITTPHAAALATPATQLGREIIRKFSGENTRFEVRLDPPELGRVEVKLEVSRDHRVTAVVAADSPQTLADLTRHARDIEQALQSAGLELNDNGLSFDLSQHRENLADAREEQAARRAAQSESPQDSTPVPQRALTLDAWRGARVDLVA